jgi:adenylyltransferase/sulfurtransferase
VESVRLVNRYQVDGFTDQELDYYSRQIVMEGFGVRAQRKLKEATVCLVGVGGLGSPIGIQLASMGVGHLRVVDGDVVEISNLQRQHLYGVDQMGLPKVEAAQQRLHRLNPFIDVEPLPMAVTAGNAGEIIEGADLVVGALDTMRPRYALNRACVASGTPLIHGAVLGLNGNASTVIPGETACLECFQGGVDDAEMPTCAMVGVHPSIVSMVASVMVSEAVRVITGQGPLLGNALMFIDLQSLSFDRVELRKVDVCPVCGSGAEAEPLSSEPVREICGREGRRVFVFTPDDDLGLSMAEVNKVLSSQRYRIMVEGGLGTTFTGSGGVRGSILKSGVTILEGFRSLEEVTRAYEAIFSH